MTKRRVESRIAALEADGFDKCRPSWEGVHVGCSQCEALVIQGVATHETGCPNARRAERQAELADAIADAEEELQEESDD